jgi:peptidoglycan hydrolase-like protein with peptidoglycan-binding domain
MTIKHGVFLAALIVGVVVGATGTFIFINKNKTANASTYALESDLGGGRCLHVDYDQGSGKEVGRWSGTWGSGHMCNPALAPGGTNRNNAPILKSDTKDTLTSARANSIFYSADIELSSTNLVAVKFTQDSLVKGNYLPAKSATGKFDGATIEALKSFQKAKGLKVTGTMTLETISALDAVAASVSTTNTVK